MEIKSNIWKTTAVMALLMMNACGNDDFLYQDEPRVRIEAEYRMAVGTDSVSYSFATEAKTITETAIQVDLTIMGNTADFERKVDLTFDPKRTTAKKDIHYSFPESVIIPANKRSAQFQVIIKRTGDLEEAAVYLTIRIAENKDFKVGVEEWSRLKIKWSDIIEKPSNWDKLTEFFGEYSVTKYRFILETTGIAVFTYGSENGMNWSQMNNYKMMVQDALEKYNNAHPGSPLTDENNKAVTFPN